MHCISVCYEFAIDLLSRDRLFSNANTLKNQHYTKNKAKFTDSPYRQQGMKKKTTENLL